MTSPAAARLLDTTCRGEVVVVGGSGTGKTTLLVDIVAAHIAAGADPESILLLTGSAAASRALRVRLSDAVFGAGSVAAIREPMVRTVHSYAFSVLGQHASRQGNPPPRLITAAEQDSVIRDLLCGDAEDGARGWPQPLRPALSTVGFATDVRDLMARCAERGVDPARLKQLGRQHDRPEWTAVARLARQYEEVMLLRSAVGMAAPQATVPALGAAELVGSALDVFASAPDVLAAERNRIKVLLVDDAQQLDPQAAELVRVLSAGARLTVLAGDPNQAVFGFRGADARLLDGGAQRIELTDSYGCSAPGAECANAVARRLPGAAPARVIAGSDTVDASVRLLVTSSAVAEAAAVADELRRAHLVDGVPWSAMAVIVRSVSSGGPLLRRTLLSAGVPVHGDVHDGPVTARPVVHALLLTVEAALSGLEADEVLTLLSGPIGRVDPVALRRLRRTLLRREHRRGSGRDSTELLRAAVLDGEGLDALTDIQLAPVRRVRAVVTAARDALAHNSSPLDVLWTAWVRTGLQRRLSTSARRGGTVGAQADRDLDAVTAFFDLVADHVSRTPAAGLAGIVEHVRSLVLPSGRPSGPEPEAVAVVSAHAAVGRQWDTVAVAGVQEGLWPNAIVRGGVLNTQRLMDVLDGHEGAAALSGTAVTLAEERRLFLLAVGRARRRLLISAVDNDNGDAVGGPVAPSRFLTELLADFPQWLDTKRHSTESAHRPLTVAALVGDLRATVSMPDGAVSEQRRRAAARQLARLAQAGVPGAHPDTWSGLAEVSSVESLWHGANGPVRLSPSNVESLIACPLRWMLERHGGGDQADPRRLVGTLVHALLSDPAADAQAISRRLDDAWETIPFESTWYARNELERHREMLETFAAWHAVSRAELTEVGREVAVDGVLTPADGAHPEVRLVGRIDRLERDAQGRAVVVDLKTGKSPATKDDAQQHAQLATYQLAAAAGLVEGEPAGEPGGARLVYVAKPAAGRGATERHQDPLTLEAADGWRETVHAAATATQGPRFVARINDGCSHCPVRGCCPAQSGGQAVGQS